MALERANTSLTAERSKVVASGGVGFGANVDYMGEMVSSNYSLMRRLDPQDAKEEQADRVFVPGDGAFLFAPQGHVSDSHQISLEMDECYNCEVGNSVRGRTGEKNLGGKSKPGAASSLAGDFIHLIHSGNAQ